MKRICVVCEGQTEEEFITKLVAPAFYNIGLNLVPELIETSPGHKGGALNYDRVKRHLRNRLREKSLPVVTTLFDLYKLDNGFPNFAASLKQPDLSGRLQVLETSLHEEIIKEAGCRPDKFIPFIQPYEFEALLFSDISMLVSIEKHWASSAELLNKVRMAVESPEFINDSPLTKPAAYLNRELKNPTFRKRKHGPIAAEKIGLAKIEAECKFFASWLLKLRTLAVAE